MRDLPPWRTQKKGQWHEGADGGTGTKSSKEEEEEGRRQGSEEEETKTAVEKEKKKKKMMASRSPCFDVVGQRQKRGKERKGNEREGVKERGVKERGGEREREISSVESVFFDPASGITTDEELADLVVAKDGDGKGDGREKVAWMDGTRSKDDVGKRTISDNENDDGFDDETDVEGRVSHALIKDGEETSLAGNEIGPLTNDDGSKDGGVCVCKCIDSLIIIKATIAKDLNGVLVVCRELVGGSDEGKGREAKVTKDNEIGIHASKEFNHSHLEI